MRLLERQQCKSYAGFLATTQGADRLKPELHQKSGGSQGGVTDVQILG